MLPPTTPVKRKSETMDLRPPKLPKIVSEIRIIQTQLGIRKQLSPEEKDKYTSMPKPDRIKQRVIDPEDCKCRGYNSSYAYSDTQEKETVGMVSEEELAGPEWLNSKAHAKIVFDSTPDEDKFPHPIPALADAGVKVIEMSKSIMLRRRGTKRENGISAEAGMSSSDFKELRDSIDNGLGTRRLGSESKPKAMVKCPA